LAVDEGKLAYLPKFPALPERNARQGFFERAEFEVVVRNLPMSLDELVRFAYLSGWRRGEILGLRWEDVDRAAGEVRLTTSKKGEGRALPLEGELAALIERRWQAREFESRPGEPTLSAFVFHRHGRPLGNFTKAWRAACGKAKVPGKIFHDLRRTAVRDMIRSGVSQHVAMSISGHRTTSMFQRYNITSAEDKFDALRRCASYLEARPEKLDEVSIRTADSDKLSDSQVN